MFLNDAHCRNGENQCVMCGGEDLKIFEVPEMMIGLRNKFNYGHCQRCGCIIRLSRIDDFSPYYGDDYYNFLYGEKPEASLRRIRNWLKNQRDRFLFTRSLNPLGWLLAFFTPEVSCFHRLVGYCGLKLSNRVLDIGCGWGHLLRRMAGVGFQYLVGIDSYIPEKATCNQKSLKIKRIDFFNYCERPFDLIMFHHSFEHFLDHLSVLKHIKRILAPDGLLLIRQPLSDSLAFQRYGRNWFQLDAPRHAVIHSVKSMEWLLRESGLRIKKIIWDSNEQQFWASEQYARDIPLFAEKSYLRNPAGSLFSVEQIKQWKGEAAYLNRIGQGDQAVFYISKD